jgi:hypothetical protein
MNWGPLSRVYLAQCGLGSLVLGGGAGSGNLAAGLEPDGDGLQARVGAGASPYWAWISMWVREA